MSLYGVALSPFCLPISLICAIDFSQKANIEIVQAQAASRRKGIFTVSGRNDMANIHRNDHGGPRGPIWRALSWAVAIVSLLAGLVVLFDAVFG